MALQRHRLTSKQIHTPQAVLHLRKEREPRRPTTTEFWRSVFKQHSANQVFVDRDPKGLRNDQGNARAAEAGIAAFECHNGANE
jgi:hypothetical protein